MRYYCVFRLNKTRFGTLQSAGNRFLQLIYRVQALQIENMALEDANQSTNQVLKSKDLEIEKLKLQVGSGGLSWSPSLRFFAFFSGKRVLFITRAPPLNGP